MDISSFSLCKKKSLTSEDVYNQNEIDYKDLGKNNTCENNTCDEGKRNDVLVGGNNTIFLNKVSQKPLWYTLDFTLTSQSIITAPTNTNEQLRQEFFLHTCETMGLPASDLANIRDTLLDDRDKVCHYRGNACNLYRIGQIFRFIRSQKAKEKNKISLQTEQEDTLSLRRYALISECIDHIDWDVIKMGIDEFLMWREKYGDKRTFLVEYKIFLPHQYHNLFTLIENMRKKFL